MNDYERSKREMKRQTLVDMNKLNEVLKNPELEKEFQEVFSFVEDITGQNISPDTLTPQDIETWNKKFDEVLLQLFGQ